MRAAAAAREGSASIPRELRNADEESATLERLTAERERIGPVNLVAEQELAELDASRGPRAPKKPTS